MSHDSAAASTDGPDPTAVESPAQVERDRQEINAARQRGTGSLMWAFTRLSGPGWLQSAITLGGGSLGGSLYLGVLAGFGMMWWQPMAMILGVIMLSAIGYVTLSTGERPFQSINRHINPVLGWGWAVATLMANMVWCMPQFGLGTAALRQNLAPETLGAMPERDGILVCIAILFGVSAVIVWFYDSGGWGIKVFEMILKLMVATVVVCFFGVVTKMTIEGGLDWSTILRGFVPRFGALLEPSPAFDEVLAGAGPYADFWSERIVGSQQKVMITAAATAVGINMTFLLPYSMLARGWDRDFRGLAVFDLATGLFIPYVLATSCVVIAAANQFHAQPAAGLISQLDSQGEAVPATATLRADYEKMLRARLEAEYGAEAVNALSEEELQARRENLPDADRQLAAMLVQRDAFDLADSLKNLVGPGMAQYVFGIGVLGMAISTIIILMLINGFVVCEMLGLPPKGMAHRAGAILAGLSGALGPFLYKGEAKFWLVVPTSMFGMALLPIAYFTFLFMMNSRPLMGENMPRGGKRLLWNVLMLIAAGIATALCLWSISNSDTPMFGFGALGAFVLLAVIVHFLRNREAP